jgi:hypothetical protein
MEIYRKYNISSETVSVYKKCFDENDSPKDIAAIEWQFLNNGNSNFVTIAEDNHNNKIAAIYATFSMRFNINNKNYIGCQSLDTITDISYRGKGLFINLAKDVYQKAIQNEVALVYGFPNGNSIHGFKKKLEWEVLDPVPFLIKPLKSNYFTSKIKFLKFLPNFPLSFSRFKNNPIYKLEESLYFPEEINTIWTKFSQHFKVAVTRDTDYLKWRYLEKPNENYKILHCYGADKQYLGFVVYTVKTKHGGSIGYIMELIYDIAKPEVGDLLVSKAVHDIKELKADCILSWCMEHSPNYSAFRKNLFFNLPQKLRPIELHFGARSFDKSLNSTIHSRTNWYLSYSDSDTV